MSPTPNPRDGRSAPRAFSPTERFWAKVQGGSFETCWEWQAALVAGYGTFTPTTGKAAHAHRWAYEQMIGPIPDGLHLDHLCRNTKCVNPWHLDPVTPKVNAERGERPMRTHCPQGHPYSGENLYRYTDKRGYTRRYCRTCMKASVAAFRERAAA